MDYKLNKDKCYYNHITGNKIIFIKNDCKNLCFSIAFRTKSENDKGVAHILEHVILRGSLNYNVKDPFNDILKSSLYSYLNAITYPDKTVFPIATYNEDEFLKIIDVYLDAIYNPLLKEEVFLQEKEIVFNEMKGFYNNIYELIVAHTKHAIFKNSHIESFFAGSPKRILEVSHKDILDYYNNYYLNKEAYIYLYGDLDIDKYLIFFEKFFTAKTSKTNIITDFENTNKYITINYEGDENYITINYILDDYTNFKNIIIAEILIKYLKHIFNNDLINIYFDKEIKHPTITIITKKQKLNQKIKQHILFDNLYKDILDHAINQVKFFYLDNYGYKPTGLVNNFLILNNYLNQKNIFEPLNYMSIIDKLQKDCLINYFRQIISTEIIVNLVPNKKIFSLDKHIIKSLDFDNLKLQKQVKISRIKDLYFYNLDNVHCYYLMIMFKLSVVDYYSLGLMQKLDFDFDNIYISHEVINDAEYFIFNLKGLVCDFEQNLKLVEKLIKIMLLRSNLNPNSAKQILQKQYLNNQLDFGFNKVLSNFYISNSNIDRSSYFDFYAMLCEKNQIYEPQNIFSKSNLDIYLGTNEVHLEDKISLLDEFKSKLFDVCKSNDIFIRPTDDNFKLEDADLNIFAIKTGIPLGGELLLLSHIIENDYILNKVRLDLGAYGYGVKVTPNGDFVMYSFKDPNKNKTIDVFKNAYNYINDLSLTKQQLNDYKIGCFNNIFKPTHEYNSYKKSLIDYFYKINYDMIFEQIKQVSNIKNLSDLIKTDKNNSSFI